MDAWQVAPVQCQRRPTKGAAWNEAQATRGDMQAAPQTGTRSETAARLAYALSATHCESCRAYHAVWPYLRLIDPPRGVDSDRDRLLGVLSPLLRAGSRVLLAGSADAGLGECVLDAAADRPVDLTVVDLCETPLRHCAALLGNRAGGRLVTRRASISGQVVAPPADLVVAHSVLSFLATKDLGPAADFINRSLHPGGRLVLTTQIGGRAPATDIDFFRRHVLTQLAARSVPLPDTKPVFAALLDAYAGASAQKASHFADTDALRQWLNTAGMGVETIQDLPRETRFDGLGAPIARASDGVLVVARKGLAG
jgi:hypothetical protein